MARAAEAVCSRSRAARCDAHGWWKSLNARPEPHTHIMNMTTCSTSTKSTPAMALDATKKVWLAAKSRFDGRPWSTVEILEWETDAARNLAKAGRIKWRAQS